MAKITIFLEIGIGLKVTTTLLEDGETLPSAKTTMLKARTIKLFISRIESLEKRI